jgi:hypothetical protein
MWNAEWKIEPVDGSGVPAGEPRAHDGCHVHALMQPYLTWVYMLEGEFGLNWNRGE